MPKLSHKLVVTNPNTGVDNEIIFEGLASFSGSRNHTDLESYFRINFCFDATP